MNDQQRAAMQMALEALEEAQDAFETASNGGGIDFYRFAKGLQEEITALREALRNASEVRSTDTGEPVAWVAEGKERVGFGRKEVRKFVVFDQTLPVGTAFYTTPPSVEAAIEATKEKATKVCDDLYKHDRKDSGYDEGWNDALGTAEQAIRSMK